MEILVEHGIGAGLPIKSTIPITVTPGTTNQVLAKGQYLKDITVQGDANLLAANILSGKSIFGIAGSAISGKRFASGTNFSDNTAVAFQFAANLSTTSMSKLSVAGLTFKPSLIMAISADSTNDNITIETNYLTSKYHTPTAYVFSASTGSNSFTTYAIKGDYSPAALTDTGFSIPVAFGNQQYRWIAIG